MLPIDIRNATFKSLQSDLNRRNQAALQIWLTHGPGTTKSVAIRGGWDILSFRPRTTDLYQMGLVTLVGKCPDFAPASISTAGTTRPNRSEPSSVQRDGVSPAGIVERSGNGPGAAWSPYLAVSQALKPRTALLRSFQWNSWQIRAIPNPTPPAPITVTVTSP